MTKLIGISGKKYAGKDTVADIISRSVNYTTHKIGFADAVYEELAIAIWPDIKYNPYTLAEKIEYMKNNKDAFRRGLQFWGTDYRRNLTAKRYWIAELFRRCLKSTASCIIVNDVRFVDEAEAIKEADGILIRVERGLNVRLDAHESEVSLDDYNKFNYTITNYGTIQQLEEKVKEVLKQL